MDTTNIKHGEYIGGEKLPDNLVKLLSESDTIAIDTEADSLHHYFHRVCLIQLNVNENYFIIDPLQCKDMEKLFSLFADKLIILHGGDYDIRVMKRDFGFIPHKVFDTMIAMQLLGYEKLGLADLVERHFRIVLAKGPQKMDWSMRPLPEKMITYAVNDVKYLLKLHKILMNELEEKNRVNWVEENCAHLIESSVADKGENDELWRIKGSYVLNRAELEYLKELWLWREEEAKLTNVPVFRIFKNEWLLELARWCAQEKEKPLTESPLYGLISPWKERAYRAQTAINKARKTKPSKWPFVKKPVLGKRKDVDPEIMELLKKKKG